MIDEQFAGIQTTHILEHYKNHCEFFGYSVEEVDEFCISCRHPRKDPFRLILLNQGAGILSQTIFGLPEYLHNDLTSLYMYANDLNKVFVFLKACIRTFDNNPPTLFLSSVFEGEYNRQSFSTFLDNIHEDMS